MTTRAAGILGDEGRLRTVAEEARILNQLLAQPAMARAVEKIEKKCYDEFLAADTSEKRVTAWARATNWKAFLAEIRGVQETGDLASKALANQRESKPTT